VLTARAEACGAPRIDAMEEVALSGVRREGAGWRLVLSSRQAEYGRLRFPLAGRFQLENLCTAVAALEEVGRQLGLPEERDWVKEALGRVRWPGRCELVSEDPPILLDVAHNASGARALREVWSDVFGRKARGVLVWASLADKDAEGVLEILRPMVKEVVCVGLSSPRALMPEILREMAERRGIPARVMPIAEAKRRLPELCTEADFGCVAGSVYLAGEWMSEEAPDGGDPSPG